MYSDYVISVGRLDRLNALRFITSTALYCKLLCQHVSPREQGSYTEFEKVVNSIKVDCNRFIAQRQADVVSEIDEADTLVFLGTNCSWCR